MNIETVGEPPIAWNNFYGIYLQVALRMLHVLVVLYHKHIMVPLPF